MISEIQVLCIMASSEVITLQLGSFSNFACSHLWNLQANCFYYSKDAPFGHEFNHDVFYREGRNLQNKMTFNPRTVLIDLKGSTRTATWPVDHAYDGNLTDEGKFWDGPVQIHKAEPFARSSKSEELGEAEYKPMASDPITRDSWAGYLQNKFHPKSVRGRAEPPAPYNSPHTLMMPLRCRCDGGTMVG
ncbi:protein misato1-like [Tropilaelaps mercedesae]|uniref:Protein misato1-like n=1 Tax=Tropilaelaps mercedesae TaxID=418985 RepID=A0A1V9X521_9ACAR|nr:protein misato1-like [Tropilaelaps mercedesae]